MTDLTKIDKSLVIAIIDAVIDVASAAAPLPVRIALRVLKSIASRYIDDILATVAANQTLAIGATGATPNDWQGLILAVLDAVAKVTEGMPVVHKTVLALREAVAGPFFHLVYDLIVARGQAEAATFATPPNERTTARNDLFNAIVAGCECDAPCVSD